MRDESITQFPPFVFEGERRCANPECAKILTQHPGEKANRFAGRKTCGRRCRDQMASVRRRNVAPPKLCLTCGGLITRHRKEKFRLFVKRIYCSVSCSSSRKTPKRRDNEPCTWIERALYEALDEAGIRHEPQAAISGFYVDCLIGDDLIIECYGDYWHANPRVYPNGPIWQSQKNKVNSDRRRLAVFRERGFRVVVLWEFDIKACGAAALVAERILPLLSSPTSVPIGGR